MRLIVAGGGTGGHLFPGIAVAEEFLATPGNEVLFVGTSRGIEARMVPRLGYRLALISASGVKGLGAVAKVKSGGRLLFGCLQAQKILRKFRPDLVLGVGGYASAPVLLAARALGIPTYVHEQNAIPGLTNRLLGRFARRVFISMEQAATFFPPDSTVLTGNPIRKEILWGFQGQDEESASTFRVLVFGGSAGAHSVNLALVAALPHLLSVKERLVITHQTGEKDLEEVRAGYRANGFDAEVKPFIDDMSAAYGAADLIICRAGATTIAEITACGKACIFVPFPYAADDHQRKNAESLVEKGAGFMILDKELTGERVAREITALMEKPELLEETRQNAKKLAHLDAAQVIVTRMVRGY
ncbi:undecaprenyldiphospho-muramoylpentapeptide beta-N-acetylglucosaminyltransferase [Geomonas sp. RF6]|uniref:undecaprenyldiphospho-muramoylpentapeptide beta-N-acetylglucosaminyltransferase n=1 Tax=Geomonas sp. RF6 TaxID=2897342 RepID=UPI001E30ADC1|nr:undecaprenyldiphospho-muramoylpentapeptide beta-N-acetylglucosaminyltransferase [Geomonas sp. RF6]UFS71633.1 undecaprenyldiphospho-muramoylpentapeptide beta-N-acetylglucosaminyltransferase [Geomonas sp. RF6]